MEIINACTMECGKMAIITAKVTSVLPVGLIMRATLEKEKDMVTVG